MPHHAGREIPFTTFVVVIVTLLATVCTAGFVPLYMILASTVIGVAGRFAPLRLHFYRRLATAAVALVTALFAFRVDTYYLMVLVVQACLICDLVSGSQE